MPAERGGISATHQTWPLNNGNRSRAEEGQNGLIFHKDFGPCISQARWQKGGWPADRPQAVKADKHTILPAVKSQNHAKSISRAPVFGPAPCWNTASDSEWMHSQQQSTARDMPIVPWWKVCDVRVRPIHM